MRWLWLLLGLLAGTAALDPGEPNERTCSTQEPGNPAGGSQVRECQGTRPGTSRFHTGDGYFYLLQRQAGGRMYLRCVAYYATQRCNARASMSSDRTDFTRSDDPHNHGPDELFEQVMRLRESLMEASRVRPNVRVELIYHDVCRSVRRDVSNRVTLASIRSSMVRAQVEHRPPIPQTLEELNEVLTSDEALRETLDRQGLLYQGMVGEAGQRSLIFMSMRVVQGVNNLIHLFGDGTFYARPNNPPSAQLYTFLTSRDNHVIPLCFILMESMTMEAYLSAFREVRRLAPHFIPEVIMTDFETAQQSALSVVFPRARLTGCLWHYSRALARNIRSRGLHDIVRDNPNAFRIARLCLAIPLAPPRRLQEALNAIVEEARRLNVYAEFRDFFQYIRQTWLQEVGEEIVCVFGVRHRTNNVAECFHRNLNSRLVRRPNVWRFIEVIQEMEDIGWRDLGRIEMGQAPSRGRRLSALLNDARVRSCSRQVMEREMDMLHFLSSISHHLESTLRDSLIDRSGEEEGRHSPVRSGRLSQPRAGPPASPERVCSTSRQSLEGRASVAEELPVSSDPLVDVLEHQNHFEDLMEVDDPATPPRAPRTRGGRRGRRPATRARAPRTSARAPTSAATSAAASSATSVSNRVTRAAAALSPTPSTASATITAPTSSIAPSTRPLFARTLSNPEEVPETVSAEERRWMQCIICYFRVGRYCLLGCGAFPVCGTCINHWFIENGESVCPHCRGPNRGWLRMAEM